jgi:hypothetical protein
MLNLVLLNIKNKQWKNYMIHYVLRDSVKFGFVVSNTSTGKMEVAGSSETLVPTYLPHYITITSQTIISSCKITAI